MSGAESSRSRMTVSRDSHNVLSTQRFRHFHTERESSDTGEEASLDLIIWGTDVNVETCKNDFKRFLTCRDFKMVENNMLSSQSKDPLYVAELRKIYHNPQEPYLFLNCAHLKMFDSCLHRKLINYAVEVIQIFDIAVNEYFQALNKGQDLSSVIISVRPYNIVPTITLESLDPMHIGTLVTLEGMVTKCSDLQPEIHEGFFLCTICFKSQTVIVENDRLRQPLVCTHCKTPYALRLVHNRSKFVDRQQITIQESLERVTAARTPYTITLTAYSDLVNRISPGEHICVTGIYMPRGQRVRATRRALRAVFIKHLHIIHYRTLKTKWLCQNPSDQRVAHIRAIAKEKGVYGLLASYLCPEIMGHLDVKKGLLLQMLSGTHKKKGPGPDGRHFRSNLHILLCGDPGAGKGSTGVGMTAYITPERNGNKIIQPGPLVMSAGGVCCIDEFDKMSEDARSVLHEVMEQQTVSVAKAGFVGQLSANTSILAASNPTCSEWNHNKNIMDNLGLSPTLLSRFDLIFLLLDPNTSEFDTEMAKHLIAFYRDTEQMERNKEKFILLRDYIAYARSQIQPVLTPDANKCLVDCYIEMRKTSYHNGCVQVYPRNLETLIRLSEAHAKVRLSGIVEEQDVRESLRLYRVALKYSDTDPLTGKVLSNLPIDYRNLI